MSHDTSSNLVARVTGWAGWGLLAATLLGLLAKAWIVSSYADAIAAYELEYAGGGSGKWRTPEGEQLANLVGALMWAYLTAPAATLALLVGTAGARTWIGRIAAIAGAVIGVIAFLALRRLQVPGMFFS